MIRVRPSRVLLASAFASALIAASAAAQDAAAPSPVPAPYPNTSTPDPETPTTAPGNKGPSHKHIAGVKYEDRMSAGVADNAKAEAATVELTESDGAPARSLTVVGLSWGKLRDAGTVYSADPMEGGQIVAKEGDSKPSVGEMNVTKLKDQSSSNLAQRTYAPGKPTYGNVLFDAPVMVPEPVAKGTAKFKTLMGACTNGTHIKEATIVTRSSRFTLHDATVVSVEPAEAIDGQPMEEVTVAYDSVDQ